MPTVTPDPVSVSLSVPIPADVSSPTTHLVAARSLYLYVNEGIAGLPAGGEPHDQDDVQARSLYLYVNEGVAGHPAGGELLDGDDVLARSLYLYYNLGHDRDPTDVAARSLYLYGAYDNTELFPWIEKIEPVEQLRGGQVAIYGDGFGATELAEGGVVRLGDYDPTIAGPGDVMGVVSWSTRSANLHPANSETPTEPAIIVTVPPDAESGMLSVEETT